MEKKQTKTLIILGAVIIVLLVLFFVGKALNKASDKKEEASEAAKEINFTTVSCDNITSFSYLVSGNKVNYENKNDVWYACSENSTASVSVNSANVTSALDDVKNSTASEIITGSDIDLEAFGFNDPVNVITLTDSDGNTQKITIGAQNTVTNKYYMYLNDDKSKIYVINSAIYSGFDKTVEEMSADSSSSSGYGY